jgi:regulator of sigma E protease
MEIFGNLLDWVLAFFLFSLLLFIHESGHFVMSRLAGVKVEEFGFGFPPRLLKLFTWKGTDFTLNAIPFGAFVRPAGEDDPTVEGGLAAASKRARAAVLLGGVIFNIAAALLAFTVTYKLAFPEAVKIVSVVAASPAVQAGLLPGDEVVAIDDQPIRTVQALTQYVYDHLGMEINFHFRRGDVLQEVRLAPRTTWPEGQGPCGIELTSVFSDRHNWLEAAQEGLRFAWEQVKTIAQLPGMILRGGANTAALRPVGPVGILDVTEQIVGAARENNRWIVILDWMGSVNLALGIGNLLPIPALDGGRLLFVLIEAVRGRRVKPERERMVHATALLLLLGLMLVITYLDFFAPILPR